MPLTNEVIDLLETSLSGSVSRRAMLARTAGAALAAGSGLSAASAYRVGVGVNTDAYAATVRAIDASAEWPLLNVAGKVVVIKPNLVGKAPANTGIVTDPEVVRAVVDRLLADHAAFILIVEAGPGGANFSNCGYDFFRTYDPGNRIRVVDLQTLPIALAPLQGWIYWGIWAAPLVLRRDFVFINIAKLKTHAETLVTLSIKNLFGIPAIDKYPSPLYPSGRFAMHDRGLHQAIVDTSLLRPTDFAVIDGIIGMEGMGPAAGSAVRMNTVIAGRNALAVDRVGLACMNVRQDSVRYLNYATWAGMGPSSLNAITVAGDTLPVRTFALPLTPPSADPPIVTPASFRPSGGQSVAVSIRHTTQVVRLVRVFRLFDDRTEMQLIKTVAAAAHRAPGMESLSWDGRDDAGQFAPAGRYAMHVSSWEPTFSRRSGDCLSWVDVVV
jgi:uncharacterized protein (DUF362 family)